MTRTRWVTMWNQFLIQKADWPQGKQSSCQGWPDTRWWHCPQPSPCQHCLSGCWRNPAFHPVHDSHNTVTSQQITTANKLYVSLCHFNYLYLDLWIKYRYRVLYSYLNTVTLLLFVICLSLKTVIFRTFGLILPYLTFGVGAKHTSTEAPYFWHKSHIFALDTLD